jgi:thiol-disulfide isomerase/thioredoxin
MSRPGSAAGLRTISMAALGAGLMLLAVAGAVAIARLSQTEALPSAVPVEANFAAPAIEFTSLEGGDGSLAAYRGKVVLVNLWATWCPPCLEEMPVLQAAARAYAGQGLVVLAINEGEAGETVRDYVHRHGLNLEVVLDPHEQAMRQLRTTALPSSYLVDPEGQVRMMWFGAIDQQHLEDALARVLNTGGVP